MRPPSEKRKKLEKVKMSPEEKGINAKVAKTVLKMFGCWKKARAAASELWISKPEFNFSDLPRSFDGKKILFLSDLHFPGFEGYPDALLRLIEPLEFDCCFLGGDYSNGTGAHPELVEPALEKLVGLLVKKTDKIFGVLGNHDVYSTAVLLEELGVKMLVNDNAVIDCGNERVAIVGVDDDYRYLSTDWKLAEEGLEPGAFKILLSHSPDNCREAAKRGYDLMLSGHTHGGQICLPPGIPLVTHTKVKGRYVKGGWQLGPLTGYTSQGCGTSPLGARFYSNPELCLITIRKAVN
jgi:predicted MPP superfamily phosphohydrolase